MLYVFFYFLCRPQARPNGYLARFVLVKWLFSKIRASLMVILQDSWNSNGYLARFVQVKWLSCKISASQMVILQDSCKSNGYLTRFLQDEWLSYKILARRMLIMQDSARKSCKTMHRLARFCKNLARSCKITIRFRPGVDRDLLHPGILINL